MHVDEERKHVLTSIRKSKKGIKIKESDYKFMITEFNCKIKENNNVKSEVYNFKIKNAKLSLKSTHQKLTC